ncbi:serine/threonine-protein kinase SBK1-like isoform X1 [Aquarana catesbeiana]|uniref:serine/threonine-protein kinase SBK1-like isoform X1 n=1 Tax=Aquarana catesbeiana TaxID=8400 RepID=UPI003CC94C76
MDENEQILQQMMNITSRRLQHIQLKERYRITKELGSGSYGHVIQAEHKLQGKVMALKLMKKTKTKKDNFLMEYCVSLCLSSHPNIISTFSVVFETNKYFSFAQELAPAGDLYSITLAKVGLPETIVKRCAMQLAEALDFMHSKALVHRDVKLDNVLIFDIDCHCIKLADFGLTRLEGFPVSPMKGILPYSPPELCSLEDNESLELDSSLDVWSFGILLFCISTGYFPWDTALMKDKQYEEFNKWQSSGDNNQNIPFHWKQFTRQALHMFHRLLSINANRRSPAIEIQKYLSVPWKMNSVKDNSNIQGNSNNTEQCVDNMNLMQDTTSTDMSTKHFSIPSEEKVLVITPAANICEDTDQDFMTQ